MVEEKSHLPKVCPRRLTWRCASSLALGIFIVSVIALVLTMTGSGERETVTAAYVLPFPEDEVALRVMADQMDDVMPAAGESVNR